MSDEMSPEILESLKAMKWLEDQGEKTDRYFSAFSIALNAGVQKTSVDYAIKHGGPLIEVRNERFYRFNKTWRINETLKENVEAGLMKETKPGSFALTEVGKQYAQHLLMTDPAAQDFFQRLKKSKLNRKK